MLSSESPKLLGGLYAATHDRHFRPVLALGFGNEVIDPSVESRRRSGIGYRPPNPVLPPA
jgi:hypothetical protein